MARTTFITIMTLMMIMMRNEEEPFMPRRSSRVRQAPEFYGQLVNAISVSEPDEPTTTKRQWKDPSPRNG